MKPQKLNLWLWSDPHFHHKHAIRHNQRPWNSTEEMNEGMIAYYNSVVKPGDTCIWVGDAFFCGSIKAKAIMDRLNGKKVLVTGNHDGSTINSMNCGFDFVCEKMVLKIAEQEVLISHYPYKMSPMLYAWVNFKRQVFDFLRVFGFNTRRIKLEKYHDRRPADKGGWLLHGHTHAKEAICGRMIHVGVDANKFTPISIAAIEEIMKNGEQKKRFNWTKIWKSIGYVGDFEKE